MREFDSKRNTDRGVGAGNMGAKAELRLSGPKRTKCTILFDALNKVLKSRQNGKMNARYKKDQMYNSFGRFEQGFENPPEWENACQAQKGPIVQYFWPL